MSADTDHPYSGWRVVDEVAVLRSLRQRGVVPRWVLDCDHVTYRYPDADPAPWTRTGHVWCRGVVRGAGIEALLITVDDVEVRPDGRPYHLTLSYDIDCRVPADSNRLLAGEFGHRTTWWFRTRPVHGFPIAVVSF